MATDPVSARYAQALFELVKPAGQMDQALEQLEELARQLRQHAPLRRLLLNPDVEPASLLAVCATAIGGEWQNDVRAFVQVVLSFGRVALLVDMAEAFRRVVDKDRKIARVTVRSARPLTAALRAGLVAALERSEQRSVELVEETASELIGGAQVMVDHRMMDGSLKTRLAELRQRLKSVRV